MKSQKFTYDNKTFTAHDCRRHKGYKRGETKRASFAEAAEKKT